MFRVAVALLAMWIAGAQAQPTPFPGWIDVHAHLAGPEAFRSAPADAAAYMKRYGARKLVLMSPPQIDKHDDAEGFARIARADPSRYAFLGGGGSLNPLLHANADPVRVTDAVKQRFTREAEAILAAGAAGFGEIAVLHLSLAPGHPFEEVPPDHPLLLLLADIAGRAGVVIDLHMDFVAERTAPMGPLAGGMNPSQLQPNLAAFERLLAHNRDARIVWAHAGSDPLGQWTTARSRALLATNPNLFMSLRLARGRPANQPLDPEGRVKVDWLELFREFDDRFVIGTDSFHVGNARGSGPGIMFSQANDLKARSTQALLAQLPPELARKIGYENAMRLYRLTE